MTVIRTLGAVCAAALITVSGAAYAGQYTPPPPPSHGKNKVEIYIKVKSGAEADVDYVTKKHNPCQTTCPAWALDVMQPPRPPHKKGKQEIKEETAKVWGEAKVDIEAKGVTNGTFEVGYNSDASTHGKSDSTSGGEGGAQSASSSTGGGGGGCGCNSSTTSASTSGGASGSWSTGGG